MKERISRFAIVVAIVVVGYMPAFAQNPSFGNFSDTTNLQLNGAAAQASDNTVLRLTPAVISCGVDECTPTPDSHVAGSAFFSVLQPIAGGFTSQFQFQISPGAVGCCADGFAFVIENTAANALGGAGGAIGYGVGVGDDAGAGIPNSLAIEFDSFQNVWDADNHHVAVQSCGTGANNQFHVNVDSSFNPVVPPSTDPVAFNSCKLGLAPLTATLFPNGLFDGATHTVNLSYTPGSLKITVDTVLVLTVPVDLSHQLNLTNDGKAYVGFTAANGASTENHDILNWTFTPQAFQTTTISHDTPSGVTTPFDFGPFNFKSTPTTLNTDHLDITARPIPPGTTFTMMGGGTAQCIVYKNTGGTCWEFDVKCTGADCGGTYNAEFATSYDSDSTIIGAAFGKGEPDCADATTYANQITAFTQTRLDPTTKGRSGGTGSCWVALQNLTYPNADMSIVNATLPLVKKGTSISYGLAVLNLGANPATGISVTNPIPLPDTKMALTISAVCITGASGVSCTNNHSVIPPCTVAPDPARSGFSIVTCQAGNLVPFSLRSLASALIQLTFSLNSSVAGGTIITDTATVKAINPDSRTSNNSSTAVTKVCTSISGTKCIQ